jgi:hypothetical protein
MLRPAIQGGFASCNPRTQILAGPLALRASDPDGIEVSVFGWADIETGYASNERTDSEQRVGFVLPICGDGRLVRRVAGQSFIRPGYPVTLAERGDFWALFAGGAIKGQVVYANPLDGSAISGYALGAEATSWRVITSCSPGGLSIISTWSNFP